MSRSTHQTLTCPCGEVFSSPIYEYVNVAEDPQLRYTVLAGLLNVATCPVCGRRAAIAQPFIYSDPNHNLLAYVHPRSDAPEEARQLILEKLRNVYLDIVDGPSARQGNDKPQTKNNGNGNNHKKNGTEPTSPTSQAAQIPAYSTLPADWPRRCSAWSKWKTCPTNIPSGSLARVVK